MAGHVEYMPGTGGRGLRRLLVVFGQGLDDDIDARLCIPKAIEYLLDSDHRLIVKCIINSEHHAIDYTGIIRL